MALSWPTGDPICASSGSINQQLTTRSVLGAAVRQWLSSRYCILTVTSSILRTSSLRDETLNPGSVSMIKLLVGRLTKLPTHSVPGLGFGITTAISTDDASFQLEA